MILLIQFINVVLLFSFILIAPPSTLSLPNFSLQFLVVNFRIMLNLKRLKLYPCLRVLRSRIFGRRCSIKAREARKSHRLLISSVIQNEHLLSKILLRIPVKSLLQLKCVCRKWNTLISEPFFCFEKSKRVEQPIGVFVRSGREEIPTADVVQKYTAFVSFHIEEVTHGSQPSQVQLRFGDRPLPRSNHWPDLRIPLVMADSCNGLACCYTCAENWENFDADSIYEFVGQIIVFNPTTMFYHDIPWPSCPDFQISYVQATTLAFNPITSSSYKIVMVYLSDGETYKLNPAIIHSQRVKFHVYCSSTNDWVIGKIESLTSSILFGKGIFWDGKIYWPSFSNDGMYFKVEEGVVGYFSMPGPQNHRTVFYFGENRGRIHVILNRDIDMISSFDVYEMIDETWELKYVVKNPEWGSILILPICLITEEIEEENFLVLLLDKDIVRYNCRQRSVQPLCRIDDINPLCFGHIGRIGLLYTPSLAPVVPSIVPTPIVAHKGRSTLGVTSCFVPD